jgi:hypothetical protein
MTDRELLELAAKAAEIKIGDWYDSSNAFVACQDRPWWNPLTDDGDALRLAVKLDLGVMSSSFRQTTRVWQYCVSGKEIDVPHEQDPYAATRRAIVRAAAEIGKELA